MANLEVLALDTAVPQIRAPGTGDGYAVPRDMTLSAGTTLTAPTVNATTIDATNVEVTNLKAKDGTAAVTIADSTGAVTASSTVSATKLIPTGNVTAGNGMYLPATNEVAISTNGAERINFKDDGQVYLGGATNSYASRLHIFSSVAGNNIIESHTTLTTAAFHMIFINPNGGVGSIETNGSATAFNIASDRRLKENIAPAADAGAVIDSIDIVQHDWKVGGHVRYGAVAQDLYKVAPEAVSVGDDGETVERFWGVDYSKLVPMLIKEVQSLRKRVAELEA